VIDVACVEKVGAMTGQGTSSMFAFGRATGIVEGVMACVSDQLMTLRPQEWQPLARVRGGAEIKTNARNRAMVLFPDNAQQFKRVKDSGRADAALIAYATAIKIGAIT
jgi:crossover junction endodeoxyribonuclease RuvC